MVAVVLISSLPRLTRKIKLSWKALMAKGPLSSLYRLLRNSLGTLFFQEILFSTKENELISLEKWGSQGILFSTKENELISLEKWGFQTSAKNKNKITCPASRDPIYTIYFYKI
jgi:hypothetical protein